MKKHKDLTIATALLVISLAINIGTVISVVNRPVEAIVVHKADNATVLHGKITGKEMVGKLYTLKRFLTGIYYATKGLSKKMSLYMLRFPIKMECGSVLKSQTTLVDMVER